MAKHSLSQDHPSLDIASVPRADGEQTPSGEFPFLTVDIPTSLRSHNDRVAQPRRDLLYEPDQPISNLPDSSLPGFQFQAPRPVLWPPGKPGPSTPDDVWSEPWVHPTICLWWTIMLEQLALAERYLLSGQQWGGFDFSQLPGRNKGLFIPGTLRNPEFAAVNWDYRDYNEGTGPIKPLEECVDPSTRCTLDLRAFVRMAVETQCPDLHFILQFAEYGLDNRSFPEGSVVLVPNYKAFYEKEGFSFAHQKLNQKMREFDPPRLLSRGCGQVPFACLTVNPRNVAWRPGADPPKPRVTADYGAPRSLDETGRAGYVPPLANNPGPLSINFATDLENGNHFPPITYLSIRHVTRQAAIMNAISEVTDGAVPANLRLHQSAEDMAAYYEQLPMASRCDPHNVMIVCSTSGHVDTQGCFGHTGLPHLANRLSFFFVWLILARARARQRYATPPPECITPIRRWEAARRSVGARADWATMGIFFDDFVSFVYEFWHHVFKPETDATLHELKLIMSEDKELDGPPGVPVLVLGLLSEALFEEIRNDPKKVTKYRALAEEVVAKAQTFPYRVDNELVDRMVGQFSYSAFANPSVTSELLVVRAALGSLEDPAARYGGKTRVPPSSWPFILGMATRLKLSSFVAFAPRQGRVGGTGLPVLFTFFDASCDVSRIPPLGTSVHDQRMDPTYFRGWGCLIHPEGTNVVFYSQQFITYWTRVQLKDSTATEVFACNETLLLAAPLRDVRPIDILQVGDNESCKWICNGAGAKQPAERILHRQRCDLRDSMPPTVVVVTQVVRERNKESDILTRVNVLDEPTNERGRIARALAMEDMQRLTDARFGHPMRLIPVSPPDFERSRARLSVVVQATCSARPAQGKRKRPASMRGPAVDNPYPERSTLHRLWERPGDAAEHAASAGSTS